MFRQEANKYKNAPIPSIGKLTTATKDCCSLPPSPVPRPSKLTPTSRFPRLAIELLQCHSLWPLCLLTGGTREGRAQHGVDIGQAAGGAAVHADRRAQAPAPAGRGSGKRAERDGAGERKRVSGDFHVRHTLAEFPPFYAPLLSRLSSASLLSRLSSHDGVVKGNGFRFRDEGRGEGRGANGASWSHFFFF